MKNTLLWITGRLGLVETIQLKESEISRLKHEFDYTTEKWKAEIEKVYQLKSQIASLESKNRAQTDEQVAKVNKLNKQIERLQSELETSKVILLESTRQFKLDIKEQAETIKTLKAKNKALTAKLKEAKK